MFHHNHHQRLSSAKSLTGRFSFHTDICLYLWDLITLQEPSVAPYLSSTFFVLQILVIVMQIENNGYLHKLSLPCRYVLDMAPVPHSRASVTISTLNIRAASYVSKFLIFVFKYKRFASLGCDDCERRSL